MDNICADKNNSMNPGLDTQNEQNEGTVQNQECVVSNSRVGHQQNVTDITPGSHIHTNNNVSTKVNDIQVVTSSDQGVKVTDIGSSSYVSSTGDQGLEVLDMEAGSSGHVDSMSGKEVKVTALTSCSQAVITCDEQELEDFLKEKFAVVAGEDQLIDKGEFLHMFGMQNNFFASRFFELLDQDKEGSIDLREFLQGMKLLLRGSPERKLRFLFDAYDVDGSGEIEEAELREVMKHCVEESQMKLERGALDCLTEALFEMADTDQSGSISFSELYAVLQQYPDVMENLTFSAAQWLSTGGNKKKRRSCKMPRYLTKKYFVNNKQHCVCVLVYVLINVGLFVTCVRYKTNNWAVIVARACGMSLNFNSVLILLLMLRHSITWLRTTPMRHILPVDDHVTYHRNVGYAIVVLSLIHTVAHLINIAYVVGESSPPNTTMPLMYTEVLFTTSSGVGFVGPGFAYISGVVLFVLLTIMFIFALPFVRRNGYFQLFHFTHLLYLPYWVFLTLHGPLFWMFLLLPGTVFIMEKLIPVLHRAGKGTKFFVKQVHILPSKVTHLVISHPEHFTFHPGDYVFIKIPLIARFESHPFTISSAPEQKGTFWLHVRSVGFWTKRLNQYFDTYPHAPRRRGKKRMLNCNWKSTITPANRENGASQNGVVREKSPDKQCQGRVIFVFPEYIDCLYKRWIFIGNQANMSVYIEGPYGTPSRDIFNREHAVLVASGIGVTPFASILQSVMYRHQSAQSVDTLDISQQAVSQLKRVDFIWINRDNSCFEWFANILQELEDQQRHLAPEERLLHMQMYMTSALSMSDMKGFALQVAIDAMQRKGQRSLVTGLRSQFKPGRPDWNQVFADIVSRRRGKLKVFFCGNAGLGSVLKDKCENMNLDFTQEIF